MNQKQAHETIKKYSHDLRESEQVAIDITFRNYRQSLQKLYDLIDSVGHNCEDHILQIREEIADRRALYYYARAKVAEQLVLRDMGRQRKQRRDQGLDTQRMTWEAGKGWEKHMDGLLLGEVL